MQIIKKYKYLCCLVFCFCVLVFSSACFGNKVDYKEVDLNASVEDLTEVTGSEPDKEIKEDDGSTVYTYNKSKYLDYVGSMEYHKYDKSMVYSRWTYSAKNETDGQNAYHTICENMEKDYGKGADGDEKKSTTFETKDKSIIVAYSEEDDNTIVCITTMMR